jgi:hypothetical protein
MRDESRVEHATGTNSKVKYVAAAARISQRGPSAAYEKNRPVLKTGPIVNQIMKILTALLFTPSASCE